MRTILLLLFFSTLSCYQGRSKNGVFYNLKDALNSPKKVKELKLDQQDLIILPEEIIHLKNMRKLSLQNNYNLDLADLFNNLSKLPNLEELDISLCNIEHLPKEIGDLTMLKRLIIGGNKLKSFPEEIGNLELKEIIFSQYPDDFRSIPKEEKIKLINLLPTTDILLVDYFGGVHGNFRLGKEVVKVTKEELY